MTPRRNEPTPANWGGAAGVRPQTRGHAFDRRLFGLIAFFAVVVGGVAGFTFGADQHIRAEVLAQRDTLRGEAGWVSLDGLPPHVPAIFLSVVDPDFERRGRLVGADDRATLGRDLVRQLYGLGRTPAGRAREMIYAPVLEARLDRRSLLEFYLNRVLIGIDGEVRVYGIGEASRYYLDKSPADLTVSETATLAGLLLEPRLRRPDDAPGAVGARRNEVLRNLVEEGTIDAATYREAVREPLPFQPGLRHEPMAPPPPPEEEIEIIRLERPPPEPEPEPEDG